jgi:hypothetical protein
MTILNEEGKKFFQQEIFDIDEDEIDNFLDKYNQEEIIYLLSEKLKIIATSSDIDETAWRLGRIFGDLSKRYNADTVVYSWLNIFDMKEKRSLLNFLSGYWDQSRADLNVLMGLADTLNNVILNELKWCSEVTVAGIDAVAIGYGNNKRFFEEDIAIKNNLSKKLRSFKEYLLDPLEEYPNRQSLIDLLDRELM